MDLFLFTPIMDFLRNAANTNNRRKRYLALILISFVSLVSCCPKDGVDRSSVNNDFNITLDIFNHTNQMPIEALDWESKLTLVLNNGTRVDSQSFFVGSFLNRFTFYFDSTVNEEDINILEVRLIDYQDQVLNYTTIAKSSYQREPTPISKNDFGNFICDLNPANWLLPHANAMSCKVKSGSKITWRAGSLISLSLTPEI